MMFALWRYFKDGLLAFSVMCGPELWILTIISSYVVWEPGNDTGERLGFLLSSAVLGSWAVWGLMGSRRLPRWWCGLASLINMVAGFLSCVSELPYGRSSGAVFLGYSLWQFIVARRPAPQRLIS